MPFLPFKKWSSNTHLNQPTLNKWTLDDFEDFRRNSMPPPIAEEDSSPDHLSSIGTLSTEISSSSKYVPSSTSVVQTPTTTNRQTKTKLSYLFGRTKPKEILTPNGGHPSESLKRTKSVTKLERQKRYLSGAKILNSPTSYLPITNRSRSHESLFASSSSSHQIMLKDCHIRTLHPSVLDNNFCLQITTPQSKQYLKCKTQADCQKWIHALRETCDPNLNTTQRTDNSLDIWILEAKGLPSKRKYYCKIFLDDDIYGKTTAKERRDILFWGESFTFKDLPEGCTVLRCKICRELERRKKRDNEIGYVDIPLATITGNQFVEQWYPVYTISSNSKEKTRDTTFNIRIKAKYQAIDILPLDKYQQLQQYIERDYLRLIRILEPHISLRDKDELGMNYYLYSIIVNLFLFFFFKATSLTRIAQYLSFSTSFLVDIVKAEIQSTPDLTLTFRGNSIATKAMEAYMKLIGETYLKDTLTKFVIDIVINNSTEHELEVDPGRVSNTQHLERNQIGLRTLCEKVWLGIQQSHTTFPNELKRIFWALRQWHYSQSSSDETMFNLISGSVFLRFLCPAILSPNLFGLTQEYPSEKSSRKLTLIAKTLQTLANFSRFGNKESYMKFMNDFVGKESDNMRRFLANISTVNHDYETYRYLQQREKNELNKCDIDLGREYSILHGTLAELFKQIDSQIRDNLLELNDILNEISDTKMLYLNTKGTPLSNVHYHHHHHHHIYLNSPSPSITPYTKSYYTPDHSPTLSNTTCYSPIIKDHSIMAQSKQASVPYSLCNHQNQSLMDSNNRLTADYSTISSSSSHSTSSSTNWNTENQKHSIHFHHHHHSPNVTAEKPLNNLPLKQPCIQLNSDGYEESISSSHRSVYGSQISLSQLSSSLAPTSGYHSYSNSQSNSPIDAGSTNINQNKENVINGSIGVNNKQQLQQQQPFPLAFKNPVFKFSSCNHRLKKPTIICSEKQLIDFNLNQEQNESEDSNDISDIDENDDEQRQQENIQYSNNEQSLEQNLINNSPIHHSSQSHSTKALYFVNSLCPTNLKQTTVQNPFLLINQSPSQTSLSSLQCFSSRQPLSGSCHSLNVDTSSNTIQQPLLFVNNSFSPSTIINRSTQSLNHPTSSISVTPAYNCQYFIQQDEQIEPIRASTTNDTNRRQSLQPPKMGLKALNHLVNKELPRSQMLNLYQEEKYRRQESEKQQERLQNELVQFRQQIHHLQHLMYLIDENVTIDGSLSDGNDSSSSSSSSLSYDADVTNIDDIEDDSKPNYYLEKNYCLNDIEQTEMMNKCFFLYRREDNINDDEA
ncbi:unnamed protein product [Didymodactylos carnosus]|uniref:Ras GTPase-activating protein n=1 Tax=Didymodactylos carnosus TaxID=1234261 RepID=A0A8S2GJ66_9BILA|nr:unnamed protein product [Didymodactylos carnosus]CAF3526446.1 unnamed protein product [Didymodactylos carnosus]